MIRARLADEALSTFSAGADGSFDYAQDDETGVAMESAGVHGARAGGSFGYAQDDETGAAWEPAGMLGLVRISSRWSGLWEVRSEELGVRSGGAPHQMGKRREFWKWSGAFGG